MARSRKGHQAAGQPLVSIIVPAYNAEPYLEQAVRSALDQPQDLEVILVEDGSTDGSLQVCRKLAEESDRVRLLRHPDGANHGEGASRNLGIRDARGKYVAFLDADDYYLPKRFEQDIPMLAADPTVDGVYGAARAVFEGDAVPDDACPAVTTLDGPVAPDELFSALLSGGRGWFCTDAITVRREAFEEAGLFDENLRLGVDSAMWLKMAAVCRLAAGSIGEPIAVRRRHAGNISTPANPVWRDAGCACISSVLQWAVATGLGSAREAELRDRLVYQILRRRLDDLGGLARLACVCRRVARYQFRHPWLLAALARRALRRLRRFLSAARKDAGPSHRVGGNGGEHAG